jgi:protein translocase SecG subunit
MPDFLTIIQLVAAVLMVVMILMQSGGAGLGSAFGGGGGDVYATKRGAEKTIFRSTIAFAFVFVIIGVIRLFV